MKREGDYAQQKFSEYLLSHYDTDEKNATDEQIYYALANTVSDLLYEKRRKLDKNKKTIHYISIEFLMGRSLKSNLWNMGLEQTFSSYLKKFGKDIESVYEIENDAGLGNGGLGRLAACYMESLSKCGYSAMGHSIKYEFGLFKQKIVDGKQFESPDEWLKTGRVWLNERDDEIVEVKIGGRVIQHFSYEKGLSYEMVDEKIIEAVPFDMIIPALGTDNMTTLRLWEARAKNPIDLHLFDVGEFKTALKNASQVGAINKVLYPNDNNERGRDLRLIQQYFLVSAVMQSILKNYFKTHEKPDELPNLVAVHINDTHPALIIPEFMRLMIDVYGFGWDESYDALKKIMSYTNHTVLSESLEVKSMSIIERYMPRLNLILREIDRRERIELSEFFKNDYNKIEKLSVISGNNVYMANLSVCAGNKVNGVAKIHSEILKNKLFADYATMWQNKFLNITNGISHRRWLCQANPKLDEMIYDLTGDGFRENADNLKLLGAFEDDGDVLKKLEEIKLSNKKRLADYVFKHSGIKIDPEARFDVQVKRIHEYKRQLLNVLKIIYLAEKIRNEGPDGTAKQAFIFAGKAATGYYMARRIIELISAVAREISSDEVVSKKLQVVFIENYNVSSAEIIMSATEVSEQISVAGREASGTGNMKAVLNGALMLCTRDGANIEICDKCGHENHFEFGLTSDKVDEITSRGYNAMDYYNSSEKVRVVIEKLRNGIAGDRYEDIANYLLGRAGMRDVYMCLADFDDYIRAHYEMDRIYRDRAEWNRRSLHSISSMGYFSADRSIREYAEKIWDLDKKTDGE